MAWLWSQFQSQAQSQMQQWWHRLDPHSPTPGDPGVAGAEQPHAFPPEHLTQLRSQIQALRVPPVQTEAITTALAQALDRWQQDPTRCNGLVVLGSPVDPIEAMVKQALAQTHLPHPAKILTWTQRPELMLNLPQQLQAGFPLPLDLECRSPEVVALPRLELAFLRGMSGLDGIEWIRDQVFAQRSRFWLVGCPSWAWAYLDITLQIGSYFDVVVKIPELDRKQMSSWLQPAWSGVSPQKATLSQFQALTQELSQSQDPAPDEIVDTYFKILADISKGRSAIAAQLWLGSLSQSESESESSDSGPSESESSDSGPSDPESAGADTHSAILTDAHILWKSPTLPTLPDLANHDKYLLYAVLLHRSISLPHLAVSLGASVSATQSQVQSLLRAGLLELHQGILSVSPIHYLKLRALLAGDNFLVGDT
ncbi:MAG: hypothetical protein HC924_00035 [Synechococcaceae cyanobacterium SM2_3_2]|nr:hypothetical protein [Synechococcaceae cyanobacterium SM2_3_2]